MFEKENFEALDHPNQDLDAADEAHSGEKAERRSRAVRAFGEDRQHEDAEDRTVEVRAEPVHHLDRESLPLEELPPPPPDL